MQGLPEGQKQQRHWDKWPQKEGQAEAGQRGLAGRPARDPGQNCAPTPKGGWTRGESFRPRTGSPLRRTAGLCAVPDAAWLEAVPVACCPLTSASDLPQPHQTTWGPKWNSNGQRWKHRSEAVPRSPGHHPICSCPPCQSQAASPGWGSPGRAPKKIDKQVKDRQMVVTHFQCGTGRSKTGLPSSTSVMELWGCEFRLKEVTYNFFWGTSYPKPNRQEAVRAQWGKALY